MNKNYKSLNIPALKKLVNANKQAKNWISHTLSRSKGTLIAAILFGKCRKTGTFRKCSK